MDNKLNEFLKDYDPANKYVRKPPESLDKIINNINSASSWDLKTAKKTVDYLYEFKRKSFKEKNDTNMKKIQFYIDYLNHQIDVLNDFQSELLTLIATIFLPLTFITGFFGMNFKSMGVPSLKKGIFDLKHADSKILLFSVFSIIFTVYIFYGVLKIS